MPDMTTRKRLLRKAAESLAGDGDGARLQTLATDLFSRVSLEDLAVYSGEEIAGFARIAADLLARRKPGRPRVGVVNPDFAIEARNHRDVTVVTVLNDNMPFLFDSLLGEVQDFGADLRLVAHPMISVGRDKMGGLVAYFGAEPRAPEAGVIRESLIQVHVARIAEEAARKELAGRIESVLDQVRRAVKDWQKMRERLGAAIAAYRADPPLEADEATAFLEWLIEDNFTFLGMREYDYVGGARRGELVRADIPGLGILSDPEIRVLRRSGEPVHTTPAIREFLMRPDPLIITKSNTLSKVHRRGYMDYVGVKRYDRKGHLAGELRIVGLFTSTAYTRSARTIPYLRRKIDRTIARAGFAPDSHSGKALVNVLETLPREELFQIEDHTLFTMATAIVQLGERPRVRVLSRHDRFDRFVSVLVYLPRDRHNTNIRLQIGALIATAYHGHVSASQTDFPEGPLARTHLIIGLDDGPTPEPEQAELEKAVAALIETWVDGLKRELAAHDDAASAARLLDRYAPAFPSSYRDDFPPAIAFEDIARMERLNRERPLALSLSAGTHRMQTVRLRLIHRGAPIALSVRVPLLENMGFRVLDEKTYEIAPKGDDVPSYLHDMALQRPDGAKIDLDRLSPPLTACFMAVWQGQAESDGYNALVLNAGLGWRDVALLRALSRYLLQAGSTYLPEFLWGTLNRHPAVASAIVEMFHARFDPALTDRGGEAAFLRQIEKALGGVASLDEDRVIRRFAGMVGAIVRTNFFQPGQGGVPKSEIVFKLDPANVDSLPAPRPFREIFVYSPRLEAAHLRFGHIARGGIRWSDRPQDLRTEILGLAKAQQVKNAVIVPVGAKGGFVPKKILPGAARDAILAEGTESYRIFMRSLLDITDNLDGDRVAPPDQVVRHDGDDPYLVVAADKGTASFSDIANAIAVERDFWLGDAFASGGSAGYDHKAMGITARGAWEAVKRHFREMNVDIQTTPFTAVGVGDMSGDVFGNGMLLSPATKLVAAFDHRDIFIDPDPNPGVALAERRRLFGLSRSSWQDYDPKKISKGGGVFSRGLKSVPLSAPMKSLTGISASAATPQEIIKALLKAKVDLLWFGGIGTFIRASTETDEQVGDRSNDAMRVTALEVGARVVGEGANLAMTQRARVEYGLAGGRSNSDAIDNSAGVNTSDLEVNIKIAFAAAIRAGKLDMKKRDRLLKAMTGAVAALVLRNNYLQPLAISVAERRGFEDFDFQLRLMRDLEGRGRLDRAVESLPDDTAMADRRKSGKPLTRPEIAILLAYAKLVLSHDLTATDLADDPALHPYLIGYFPDKMASAYAEEIDGHRLRREIIATVVANRMINHGGPTYVTRVGDRTGAPPAAVARAYVAATRTFRLEALNDSVDRLDGKIDGTVQLSLYRTIADHLIARSAWFVRNVSFANGIGPVVDGFAPTVAAIAARLDAMLPPHLADALSTEAMRLQESGVPKSVALQIAGLPALAEATDIHLIASTGGTAVDEAAAVFFAVDDHFRIFEVMRLARDVPATDHVDGLALDRALETLNDAHRRIAADALAAGGGKAETLGPWLSTRQAEAGRVIDTLASLLGGKTISVSRVTVAAGLLADLARAMH